MFKRRLYIKNNLDPFPISRTKIDLFFECKRCFYLDLKFGIKRPHGTPLVINNRIIVGGPFLEFFYLIFIQREKIEIIFHLK